MAPKPVEPVAPVRPVNPIGPVAPVSPFRPPYARFIQSVVPSPILNKSVSVSIPTSPEANIGLAAVHSAAKPLRN